MKETVADKLVYASRDSLFSGSSLMFDIDRQYLHCLVDALDLGEVRFPVFLYAVRNGSGLRANRPGREGHDAGRTEGRKEQGSNEIPYTRCSRSPG